MKKICLFFGFFLMFLISLNAQKVYLSELTENSVLVQLSADEVQTARGSEREAQRMGTQVAWKIIRLAGIPESITGKVAGIATWAVLCKKYGKDLYKYAKQTPDGNNLTLKYRGVNIEGVKKIWKLSETGDYILPGSEATKQIADVVNRLSNMYLQ